MKIIAIMMDNASNNDTMMQCIETRCSEIGVDFHANQARMRWRTLHCPTYSGGVCRTPADSGRLKFQCDMGQICQTESWWSLPESAGVWQILPDSAESGRLQQD
jgi:hypothetical protein